MEIKYEAVFGPQELFIDAEKDTLIIVKYDDVVVFFSCYSDFFDHLRAVGRGVSVDAPAIAMRRVVQQPMWSVTDQKAGKLPPVGSRYLGKDGQELTCVLIDAFYDVWGVNDDLTMFVWGRSRIIPIETPEEKAQRLRSEWINKAYVDFHRLGCELEVLQKEQIKQIYDALLSGELTMPNKDGE